MSRKSRSSSSYYRKYARSTQRDKQIKLNCLPPCSRCGGDRSPRNEAEMAMISPLDRIFCTRSECAKLKACIQDAIKPDNLTINIRHYHYYGRPDQEATSRVNVAELPGMSSISGRAELASEPLNSRHQERPRPSRLSNILEEVRPRSNSSTKPSAAMITEKLYAAGRRYGYPRKGAC
jgi:hypothetical protein